MPSIFKALASISAWFLFIAGLGAHLSSFMVFAAGGFTGEDWQRQASFVALGTAAIILAVVAMILRKKME